MKSARRSCNSQNNEEREQFIEAFWQRRDPTPDTVENEFKEEHYRRIAYANERFSSGIPGWRTDRGRMYIMWGPPDQLESHTQGELYNRPMQEGGGQTTTYAYEDWTYHCYGKRGSGQNITIEFVDPTGTGEISYITLDPGEKGCHGPCSGRRVQACWNRWACPHRPRASPERTVPPLRWGQPEQAPSIVRTSSPALEQFGSRKWKAGTAAGQIQGSRRGGQFSHSPEPDFLRLSV